MTGVLQCRATGSLGKTSEKDKVKVVELPFT